MDRNAPCPCGSGRKYKKCHGAAVSPEAATLPHAVKASVLRADAVLQRNRRITQEILDWADRRLTPEWMNRAYDAWGLGPEDELPLEEGDLFTAWAVYHFVQPEAQGAVAEQWLATQHARHGARIDADTVELVRAHGAAPAGVWIVVDVEPGVGMSVRTARGAHPDDHEIYVYDAALSHNLSAGCGVLAYLVPVADVWVCGGLHDVWLEQPELDAVLDALTVADSVPDMNRHWTAGMEQYDERLDTAPGPELPGESLH